MDPLSSTEALTQWIFARDLPAPSLLGLAGAQGCGKSTLAREVIAKVRARGLRADVIALDDYYLTRARRAELAGRVHPLLATRGPPGTHDMEWLGRDLLALRQGQSLRTPRFDKSSDEPAPEAEWRAIAGPLDLLLLEGWCVGAPPQPQAALANPLNALEAEEDGDGRWRGWVNAQLSGPYQQVFALLDGVAFLAAPDFSVVAAWRAEQESTIAPGPRTLHGPKLARFIAHYERLTTWMLEVMPAQADLTLRLDGARRLVSLQYNAP